MDRATTWSLAVAFGLAVAPGFSSRGQEPSRAEAADEARDRKVMERFLAVLEKSPRRGTALDRVYGYHVERGTLDGLVKGYRDKVAADPKDGASWALIGLIEAQRGRDGAAVEAFSKAEAARPDDPISAFYLGQALVLVGQPEGAVGAFERALTRRPARADLLDIYQALGRVHQRAHRDDKALDVWNRLEKAFPDDPRVQEQIAQALADEGQDAPALARFEALAKSGRDKYRQVQFALEAADLKVRLGRSTDALADFEGLLGKLDPESWLYREVRRKVEDMFLRTDDLAGLSGYYERWLKKVPDDVEAMARLGRALAGQGRSADARGWFDRAVALAPTRRELRAALIEQLAQERRFSDAASQYEALARLEPNNPDVVRDWGRMILRDSARPEADRKKAAAAVWRRLAPDDSKDAVAVAQSADLFRQSGMADEAIALYRRAIGLAPEASQYREYLGEYYHALKRPAEAQATWRATAAGPNRNARTLGRLGEVLAGFGYREEAVGPLTEACQLEPDDFDLRVRLADLRLALDQPAEALKELDRAARVASADEQAEAVLDRQVKAYQASGTLGATIDALAADLKARPTAAGWTRLARLLEADQKPTEAARAIAGATALDPRSVPAWVASARLREAAGDLLGSAEALRTLAGLDRRSRTDYLIGIAKLEARLGRREQALAAGRDLLAASPGNAEHGQFFAELCFGLGEANEGLDALRRSARANPSDPKATLTLAENLARQFRTEEAIELFWRAFARTPEIDGKTAIVSRLADQYLQRNQLDRLIARLERELREPNQQRELSFCLAQAHSASGDYSTARLELERLLSSNARDGGVLGQLSALAEQEGDFAGASKYQKQALDIAANPEGEARLAQLYLRSGEYAEAESLWTRLGGGDGDPTRALAAVDSLLAGNKRDAALAITARLLRDRPHDWELLYREGVALAGLGRTDEAAKRFDALLALPGDDDDRARSAKPKGSSANSARAAGVPASTGASPGKLPPPPIVERLEALPRIVAAASSDQASGQGGNAPGDLGQARIYAIAWRFNRSRRDGSTEGFVAEARRTRDQAPDAPRSLRDWYALAKVRGEGAATFEAARGLASRLPSDLSAQWCLLEALAERALTAAAGSQNFRRGMGRSDANVAPLPAGDVDLALACYRGVQARRPDLAPGHLGPILDELKRAGRLEDGSKVYRETMDAAQPYTPYAYSLMTIAADRNDAAGMLAYLDKLERAQGSPPPPSNPNQPMLAVTRGQACARAVATLANARAHPAAIDAVERYLAANARLRSRGPMGGVRPASASTGRRNQAGNGNIVVMTWYTGQAANNWAIDFPAPDDRLDLDALNVLRTAFDLFKRDDLLGDLFDRLGRKAEGAGAGASDPGRVDAKLALGVLRWWNDEKDDAARLVAEAADEAEGDPAPRMMLAQLLELQGDPTGALAALGAIESVDASTVQRRETQALRLAVASGDVDRARKAAERLFGLRLDSEAQAQLASLMSQLGLTDLADAVLARARRSAGNRPPSLAVLMAQYQAQRKPDQALQVALQILRLRPNNSAANANANASQPIAFNPNGMPVRSFRVGQVGQVAQPTADDLARQQAVQVVAQSGKMKDLMARAEAQLERSPNSMQVLQTLAEYALVAGDRDKTVALHGRMARARPDDVQTRLLVAGQMAQAGAVAQAAEQYQAAVRLDPRMLGTYLWPIMNAFRQAGKIQDFAALAGSVDPRALGPGFAQTNLAQALMNEPGLADAAKAMFRRLWAGSPSDRPMYLQVFGQNQGWLQDPEFFGYLRDSILPAPGSGPVPPWSRVDQVQVFNNNNNNGVNVQRVTLDALRLLDAASGLGKLGDLADDLRRAIDGHPEWKGGEVLLAMTMLRAGRFDEARSIVGRLGGDGAGAMPVNTLWVLGQDLEDHSPARDLAGPLYERAMAQAFARPGLDINDSENPSSRLLEWYRSAGRNDQARDLLLKLAGSRREGPGFDPGQAEANRIFRIWGYAQQLAALGFPAETVRLYREQIAAAEAFASTPAGRMYLNKEQLDQQAQQGIRQAIEGARPDRKADAIAALFEPVAGPGSAFDLYVAVSSPDLATGRVEAALIDGVRKVSGRSGGGGPVAANLAALREKHPDDPSVNVAALLFAADGGEPGAIGAAADRLVALADRSPLSPLGPARMDGRPPLASPGQRAEAARWLGLWLAARECWARDQTRAQGDRLATRALEAARRQAGPRFAVAMLREWGQSALDRGDRAVAERRWGELLEFLLPSRMPGPAAANPARAVAKAARRPGGPSTPLDRFNEALTLSRMAADRGLTGLSLRVAREAFRAGAPAGARDGLSAPGTQNAQFITTNVRTAGGIVRRRQVVVADQATAATPQGQTGDRLAELASTWDRQGAAAVEVYEILRDAVLPPTQPGEVDLYPAPIRADTIRHPRSLGGALADRAARVGRVEEVRGLASAARANPVAELSGLVLLAQVALAAGEPARAADALARIEAQLKGDTLRVSAELAALAATSALGVPEAEGRAEAVLDAACRNLAPQPTAEPLGSLLLALGARDLDRGRVEPGRKRYDAYLQLQEKSANANDQGQVLLALRRVAADYAGRGLVDEALDCLGRSADLNPLDQGGAAPDGALASTARALATLPPEDRYRRLKAWTYPTKQRKALRFLVAFEPDRTPSAAAPGAVAPPRSKAQGDLVATLGLLVAAAAEAGRLDDLADEARGLRDVGLAEADTLLVLAEVARGHGDEAVGPVDAMADALADELLKVSVNAQPPQVPRPTWGPFLAARSGLADDRLRPSAERLGDAVLRWTQGPNRQGGAADLAIAVLLRRDREQAAVDRAAGRHRPIARDPGLALWEPVDPGRVGGIAGLPKIVPAWVESGGIVGLSSPWTPDALGFAVPLAGRFEFSVDASATPNEGEALVSFGGQEFGSRMTAQNNQNQGHRPAGSAVPLRVAPDAFQVFRPEGFHRLTLRVEPGRVACLVDGRLISEDRDPAPTSPWLALVGSGRAYWRNPALSGSPEVPDRVPLVVADRLEGWLPPLGESVAPPAGAEGQNGAQQFSGSGSAQPGGFDWLARDGSIEARRVDPLPGKTDVPSRLAYARPLRDGESISYEFRHEPGKFEVHPSLGPVAFLLEPEGVRARRVAGAEADAAGEAEAAQDPRPVPLRPNDWNAAKLAIAGDKLTLEVNGQAVFERALAPGDDRAFGLFRYRDRSAVQVRDVTLRGDWRARFEAAKAVGLLARSRPDRDPSERRAEHALLGESAFVAEAGEVIRKARELPPEGRFDALAGWVLPGPDRPTFRLAGAFTPLDPPPAEGETPRPGSAPPRSLRGGEAESPASDLVRVAAGLGRLDPLAERIERGPSWSSLDDRGRFALLAMVRAAQGRDEEGSAALARLRGLAATTRPADAEWTRWPELVAALGTFERPKLRADALALLPEPAEATGEQIQGVNDFWLRQVHRARSTGEAIGLGESPLDPPPIPGWATVPRARMSMRAGGFPRSAWVVRDGEIRHASGLRGDALIFRTPLRGDFAVDCELTTRPGGEAAFNYGGWLIRPEPSGQAILVQQDDAVQPQVSLTAPLDLKGGWAACRLALRANKLSLTINGRLVFERPIPPDNDPWLIIQATGSLGAGARKLAISGQPVIPDRLRLADGPSLAGWTATEFEEMMMQGDNSAWRKRGDEILGRGGADSSANGNGVNPLSLPSVGRANSESVLRYRRPMLEDGTVTYEFLHDPGKAGVHPSLGRLAFLLEPEGVTVHRLTDGFHDRTGLDPANASAEPAYRRGPASPPLRPGEWNRVALAIRGDTLAITLNGTLVFERSIDPTNQRGFGLFHWTDRTEARVRAVTFEGDWPKALPAQAK